MRKIKNIFFDLDGTLFEWNELSEGQLWILNTAMYYALLKPQMKSLVKTLAGQARLYTCSVFYTPAAREGKDLALNAAYGRYFPQKRRIYVPKGVRKAEYVMQVFGRELTDDDILLDDHSANLLDWENAGGTAFKVLNGQNGKGEKWHGRRMTLDGRVELPVPERSLLDGDEKAYRSLVYAVYERAVEDYLLLLKREGSENVTEEKRDIEDFLKKDLYGFGTGQIRMRLGIV